MTAGLPTIDVVIPVYLPGAWLNVCVGSVLASVGVATSITIVDDSPNDPSVGAFVNSHPTRIRLVTPMRNVGYAIAVNLGIEQGRAAYVLVLNQDASIHPGFLELLARRLNADTRLAAVGGKVLHRSTPDDTPDGLVDTAGIEFRKGRRAVDIGQGDPDDGQFDGWREVFGVCAAAALYRRSALDRVKEPWGLFDERFFMHKEDVDLAWRLRAAGYKAGVDGAAVAYHARGTQRARDDAAGKHRLSRIGRLLAAERAKSPTVRRLAWRNQMLMLIKNERAADLRRSIGWLAAYQLAYFASGLVIDPAGTVRAQLGLLALLPQALARRRAQPPGGVVDARWLP